MLTGTVPDSTRTAFFHDHIQPYWCYVSESFKFLQQFLELIATCMSRIVISLPDGLGSAAASARLLFLNFKKKIYQFAKNIIECINQSSCLF